MSDEPTLTAESRSELIDAYLDQAEMFLRRAEHQEQAAAENRAEAGKLLQKVRALRFAERVRED